MQVDDCSIASCSRGGSFWSTLQQRFVWLNLVIASVALVYMALSFKALVRSLAMLARARGLVHDLHRRGERLKSHPTEEMEETAGSPPRDATVPALDGGDAWQEIPFSVKIKLFNIQ